MRYASLDVETTGLDAETDQILEFAVVFDDLEVRKEIVELPVFHCYVRHSRLSGNAFALNMNAYAIGVIAGKTKTESRIIPVENVVEELYNFIRNGELAEMVYDTKESLIEGKPRFKLNVAGKNPAFDLGFVSKLPGWGERFKVNHRTIDPAVMFMGRDDKTVPSLQECLVRAGIGREVKHTAASDAYDVIELIRMKV